jgi:hypothetical protein
VGLWSEKCEALKALLYIYQTFHNDIPNPVEFLIIPQVERFWDDAWQVVTIGKSHFSTYDVGRQRLESKCANVSWAMECITVRLFMP